MRERLLVCTGCGEEHCFSREQMEEFRASDCCPTCGDVKFQDFGWIEVEA